MARKVSKAQFMAVAMAPKRRYQNFTVSGAHHTKLSKPVAAPCFWFEQRREIINAKRPDREFRRRADWCAESRKSSAPFESSRARLSTRAPGPEVPIDDSLQRGNGSSVRPGGSSRPGARHTVDDAQQIRAVREDGIRDTGAPRPPCEAVRA
ncbi:MAG TPA: hypothetical protein VFL83_19365 [Anaeromyxobacter sp.]|nr:hypothetical protein [Anaeromyxobacter sp.]